MQDDPFKKPALAVQTVLARIDLARIGLAWVVLARVVLAGVAAVICSWGGAGFAIAGSSPELHTVLPRGVQRGTEQTLTLKGLRLKDAQTVFFYGSGISVKSLSAVDAKNIQIVIDVDDDCRLGQHVLQVHCRKGVSDFRTIFVGPFSTVIEKEPNNEFSSAQKVELNRTVSGIVAGQDADCFSVSLDAGQRLSVEVEAMRLGNFFDSIVAVHDGDQNEIAACDDTEIHDQDGFISFIAQSDGIYYVTIGDAVFDAPPKARYRLHIGDFDRPNLIFPPGGKTGQPLEGEMLTKLNPSALPPHETAYHRQPFKIQLPRPTPAGDLRNATPVFTDGPSPLPLRVNNLENVNLDRSSRPSTFKDALAISVPTAINGILLQPFERHHFKFDAKKNQKISIDVFAKRIGSPLDPILNVFNAKRKSLIGNDDGAVKPDSHLVFQAPADGTYFLRVMDYLNRGDHTMVYRIEATPVTPLLSLSIKRNDRFTQKRLAMAVPQGGRFAAIVSAKKEHFKQDVQLEFLGLPAGVTATVPVLKSKSNELPVVFQSTDGAKVDFRLVTVAAKSAANDLDAGDSPTEDAAKSTTTDTVKRSLIPDGNPEFTTRFTNTSLDSQGPPNNSTYHPTVVDKLPVAVVDALPFSIEIRPLDSPLVRNGSANVKVIAHRNQGFKEKIRLQFPYRPPGIGTKYQIQMNADQTEIDYPINANKNAQLGQWPFYVIATANVQGPAWTSSQLETVQVQRPFCKTQPVRSVGQRNETILVECQLQQLRPFTGTATAELKSLPPHVTVADVQSFDQTTDTIKFELLTNDKSPFGQHKNIFVEVSIPVGKGRSVARAGDVVLQINQPLSSKAGVTHPERGQ